MTPAFTLTPVLLLLLSALALPAATFFATPALGDSAINLRQAINDANANPGPDIVRIAAGTYLIENAISDEDGTGGDLDINDDLTIQGASSGTTIIDGGTLDRVIDINGSHTVAIMDVTIQNGSSSTGGCISGGSADLALTRVVVREGIASADGGAVYLSAGSLVANHSEFLNGTARRGGGIYLLNSSAEFHHSTIAGNAVSPGTSAQGGGIYYRDSTGRTKRLQITDSIVRDNTATDDGGGIENYEGDVHITRSTIRDNTSGDDGGGIENDNHNTGGFLTVTASVFLNNSAMNSGAIDNDGELTIVNSTITGNTANSTAEESWGSGGIRNSEDTASGTSVIITNCTIYANFSHRGAGSLEAGDIGNVSTNGAEIRVQNSILGRCYTDVTQASGTPGTMLSLGSNIFEDEVGCNKTLLNGAPSDIVAFPQLGPLINDGSAGHAHLPLIPDSPAIDAGNDNAAPPADQLGRARLDGNGDNTFISDIGAAELSEVSFEIWLTRFFSPGQMNDQRITGSTADPDNDGQDNTAEYLANTDPSDGTSLFRISAISESGSLLSISIANSSANRSYTLYASDDLGTSDPWSLVGSPLRGNGGTLIIPDPKAPAARRFCRFGVTMP